MPMRGQARRQASSNVKAKVSTKLIGVIKNELPSPTKIHKDVLKECKIRVFQYDGHLTLVRVLF